LWWKAKFGGEREKLECVVALLSEWVSDLSEYAFDFSFQGFLCELEKYFIGDLGDCL
jgi:hypothetical protein